MSNWIQEVLSCTAESESPERYFYWAAVSAISAVCRRNVWLDRFFYTLYPNTFTLLIGPSGLKKSVPIGFAEKLVRMTDSTRVYSGRGSIQGIIKDLSKVYTHKSKNTSSDAKCFLVSSEFDAMLVSDEHAYSLITDLYDTHLKDEWRNIIKGAGTDELKNIYMTILGASNEENLNIALPKTALRGGFVARTMIIFEESEKCINPLTHAPKIRPNFEKLSERLIKISSLSGQFLWDDNAIKIYELWYEQLKRVQKTDQTGTLNRLHDTVLKVAMCLSLADKDDLILEQHNIEEAILNCENNIAGMKRVFLGHGRHPMADANAMVMKILLNRAGHRVTRKSLLSQLYGIADAVDLDRIIDTLSQSGAIVSDREGNETGYTMPKEIAAKYTTIQRKLNE